MHRLQVSAFTAVALVFSVDGATTGLFAHDNAQQAFGAGYLLLTVVNIIWLLYFTSEEDSLIFHIINKVGGGTGGLTPPSRSRRRAQSIHTASAPVRQSSMMGNGTYGSGYGGGTVGNSGFGPIGSGFEDGSKAEGGLAGPKAGSFVAGGAAAAETRSTRSANAPSTAGPQSPRTPLINSAGTANTSGGDPHTSGAALSSAADDSGYAYRARALYAYTASPDDPNEVSFTKGEILDIMDNNGKWWQARKSDGTAGIAPSNYLQII